MTSGEGELPAQHLACTEHSTSIGTGIKPLHQSHRELAYWLTSLALHRPPPHSTQCISDGSLGEKGLGRAVTIYLLPSWLFPGSRTTCRRRESAGGSVARPRSHTHRAQAGIPSLAAILITRGWLPHGHFLSPLPVLHGFAKQDLPSRCWPGEVSGRGHAAALFLRLTLLFSKGTQVADRGKEKLLYHFLR